jgi:tetratricopeptide (TPR) repeat protein
MIVLGGAPDAQRELVDADTSKIQLALEGLRLANHHALFGVGRGAFEVAFPAVRTLNGYSDVTHPEDIVVQWVTEWGVPATLAAMMALGYALQPRGQFRGSSRAVGAWTALVVVGAHNLVDFNLETPAIGIACAVCTAMVVVGRGPGSKGRWGDWARHPRAVAASIGLAALAAGYAAVISWPHEVALERRALYAAAMAPSVSHDWRGIAHAALERHPSEAYLPFITSTVALRDGKSAVPWIERTLELAPIYPPAHYVLARALERVAPAQARLEYRIATTQGLQASVDFTRDVLPRASALIGGVDDALELAPTDALRGIALDELAALVRRRLPATSERLDQMNRLTAPDVAGPSWRVAEDTQLDLGDPSAAPWCRDPASCAAPGLDAARDLTTRWPGNCSYWSGRTRLELAAGEGATALRELQNAAQSGPDTSACWQALGELALASHDDTFVNAAEEGISRRGCNSEVECAERLAWAAGLEERRGNQRRALNYYQRARAKAPERRDLAERTAALASKLEMHALARDVYASLAHAVPDDGKWAALAAHEESLVRGEALGAAPP